MTCVVCGKEFTRMGNAKTCSPKCSRENERRVYSNRLELKKQERRRKHHVETYHAPDNSRAAIRELCRLAEERGLSYGRFVSELDGIGRLRK